MNARGRQFTMRLGAARSGTHLGLLALCGFLLERLALLLELCELLLGGGGRRLVHLCRECVALLRGERDLVFGSDELRLGGLQRLLFLEQSVALGA